MAEPDRRIRLVLVEDHAIVRDGLVAMLERQPDLEIVATYATGEEALAAMDRDDPDLVLLDVRLPGASGIDTLKSIRDKRPRQRVLMLTSHEGDEALYQAFKAGAVGYVLKKQPSQELVEAIRRGSKGKAPLAAELSMRLAQRLSGNDLSPREIEILKRTAGGLSNQEIAAELGISQNTVKNHLANLMAKLDAADRTQAVTIALQRGIIDIE